MRFMTNIVIYCHNQIVLLRLLCFLYPERNKILIKCLEVFIRLKIILKFLDLVRLF